MTLMLILIGLSTQLFRKQSESVSTQNGRLDAQSNSRYALSLLDRELRVAGVGVVDVAVTADEGKAGTPCPV